MNNVTSDYSRPLDSSINKKESNPHNLNPSSNNNNVTQSGQNSFTTGDNSDDNSGEFGSLLSNNSGINTNTGSGDEVVQMLKANL